MGMIDVVVGGQYGSEGKGHLAAALTDQGNFRNVLVRVAGPNAGHTARDHEGRDWKLRQIPTGAVRDPAASLVIAQGSEIDPNVLEHEIQALEAGGHEIQGRLWIDSEATIIQEHDQANEAVLIDRIGSTGKGIGSARASRIMREAPLWRYGGDTPGSDTAGLLMTTLEHDPKARIIIEGTQGYALGLHSGRYPKCTSSDCRAIDFLAMAGLSPWTASAALRVWVALRTYPIRVAGDSGPMYGETTWEDLGLEPELTTVTHKVRRVGEWDAALAYESVRANGGSPVARVALMMYDHWFPGIAGKTSRSDLGEEDWRLIKTIENNTGASIGYLGTGPQTGIWLS